MLSSYTILQYLDFLLYFVLASDWNAPFFFLTYLLKSRVCLHSITSHGIMHAANCGIEKRSPVCR